MYLVLYVIFFTIFRLDLRDEMLLTLMRLRLNWDNVALGYLFRIHETSVGRLLRVWIPFLAFKLRAYWIRWVPKIRQRQAPAAFKLFPRCVGVIDCFELRIEKPTNAMIRQRYWSEYKHAYTVKFLVCTAPNRAIMYVSEPFTGRTSDDQVVKESGDFLQKLREKDVILADRGFKLKSFLLFRCGAQLLVPKFLTSDQLSRNDVDVSRKLSSARCHVERVIGRLRHFRILSFASVCPTHLLYYLTDIIIICSAIVNMHPPIL